MNKDQDKCILVIGASGFVGRRLVHALLAEGHAVRCMARTPAKLEDLAALGCKIVKGDIAEERSVAAALEGVDHPWTIGRPSKRR